MKIRGKQAFKKMHFRVIPPPGMPERSFKPLKATPGKAMSEDDLDANLLLAAGQVEKLYPGIAFRMVRAGPNSFNFIHVDKSSDMLLPVDSSAPAE